MTDTRYQRDINALVKFKRRQPLSPAEPRGPVPGGFGYAGASPPAQTAKDIIFFGWDKGVSNCGPPPLVTPVEVLYEGQRCANTTITAGDIYTAVTGGTGDEQEINKNGASFIGGLRNVESLTSNTTEIMLVDSPQTGPDVIEVRDRNSGALKRSLTTGESWHTNESPLHDLRANDTHFAFTIWAGATAGDQGLWIYQNDFTPVTQIPNPGDEDLPACDVTEDRIYKWCRLADGTARLTIYDLAGALLDTQVFTAEPLWSGSFIMYICATFDGLWVWQYPGVPDPGRIWYYPRAGGELFDQGAMETIETGPPGDPGFTYLGIWDGTRDRDFTLEN